MIKIGTRGSALALWQAEEVRGRLAALGPCSLVIIHTSGDKDQRSALNTLSTPGFFTKELERALSDGRVDLAVHSLKDVPTQAPEGLQLIATMERGDPRDTLLIRPEAWDEQAEGFPLKRGSRVGTGSNRRRAQLRRLRPDLILLDLRGNLPTRIQKLRRGDYDAILAAEAGLQRLESDRKGLHSLPLEVRDFVPAPGQAAVTVQMREDDPRIAQVVEQVNHPVTAEAVKLERSLMRRLEGGCQLPLGVHAIQEEQGWRLLVSSAPAPQLGELPEPSGPLLELYAETSDSLEQTAFKALRPLTGRSLILTRAEAEPLKERLERLGARVEHRPALEIYLHRFEVNISPELDWIFLSSVNGLKGLKANIDKLPDLPYAVVGPRSEAALEEEGRAASCRPEIYSAEQLVDAFLELQQPPQHILWPVGDLADPAPAERLRAAGHTVSRPQVYETRAPAQIESLEGIPEPELIFFSPSAFKHLNAAIEIPSEAGLISIGETTSRAIRLAGFKVSRQAQQATISSLIEALK